MDKEHLSGFQSGPAVTTTHTTDSHGKRDDDCECFRRSGVAARSDFDDPTYKAIFAHLEDEQKAFLAKEQEFRSPDYLWPRDALHAWSRVWEYPYVHFHLQRMMRTQGANAPATVIDLGSGVTFFPFSVARLGYHVQCMDIDPICQRDLERAAAVIPHQPGKVGFSLIQDHRLPLGDRQADALFCISVLEHIPDFENTVQEVARILKPGGIFILTIDLDLCGFTDIGVKRYRDLRRCLADHFDLVETEITVHPLDMLVQRPNITDMQRWKFWVRQWLNGLRGKKRLPGLANRAVWGAVLKSKHHS